MNSYCELLFHPLSLFIKEKPSAIGSMILISDPQERAGSYWHKKTGIKNRYDARDFPDIPISRPDDISTVLAVTFSRSYFIKYIH